MSFFRRKSCFLLNICFTFVNFPAERLRKNTGAQNTHAKKKKKKYFNCFNLYMLFFIFPAKIKNYGRLNTHALCNFFKLRKEINNKIIICFVCALLDVVTSQ